MFSDREEAREQGEKYYLGEPCIHGHDGTRYVSNTHCVNCTRQKTKEYAERNKEKRKEAHRKWRQENRDYIVERHREWSAKNIEKTREYGRRYREVAKETRRAADRRRAAQPEGKARAALKSHLYRLRMSGLAGNESVNRKNLGYSPKDLVESIESQFEDGMSWDNYGDWHIDHIKPIKAFIDEGVTDPSIVNSLDNLRPLWAEDNLVKGCKVGFTDIAN